MATLPETSTFDAGVYQLETTDQVKGGVNGVSNAPLKNLANRTRFLKDHVEALETAMGQSAPINSPVFTGDPKAPTPALGDNDTSIATTAFVQGTVGGRLSKSVAGGANVTLTAVEAGNAILEFTGALTANINVIVPIAPTRTWTVKNATTGAYSLTVKTAGGTGVPIPQGKVSFIYVDGTNVGYALTDFDSVALTGTPTAPTPAAGDNDTSVATTAFVQSAISGSAFAAGTKLMFAQAAAPTGWTQVVTDDADNRMLRVVKTAGAGVGGSHSPILNNVVPAHTHGFTTGNPSADHTHGVYDPGHVHPGIGDYGPYSPNGPGVENIRTSANTRNSGVGYTGISLYGASVNHTHSGSTDNGSSQTNWQPRYIDMILCQKN